MKLVHRIAYYMGGFSIGLILLFFFLGGKRASCDYGPNARVLKNIRSKPRVFTESALRDAKTIQIDTSFIKQVLQDGDVLFSESITDLDSCNIYKINDKKNLSKHIIFIIENCKDTSYITGIQKAEK
ncbi:MAG: hypothetical protein CMC35_02070 [Flavobacteriaceae bacterium]|nr:hypothetical protein [Flavobacteriaceae bacterium]|tara:strand:- start:15260 stop:15640 length:381 start_codon:yes stop_codon:yes gene_type:complete